MPTVSYEEKAGMNGPKTTRREGALQSHAEYSPLPGYDLSGPRRVGELLPRILHGVLLRRLRHQAPANAACESDEAA